MLADPPTAVPGGLLTIVTVYGPVNIQASNLVSPLHLLRTLSHMILMMQ